MKGFLAPNVSLVYALLIVLALVVFDVILGVSLALKQGTFSFQKFPKFLGTQILPYVLPLSSLIGAAQLNMSGLAANTGAIAKDGFISIAWTVLGGYAIKLIEDIANKLASIFGVNIQVTENKPPTPGAVGAIVHLEADTVTGYQTGDHVLPGATKVPGQPG